MSTIKHIATIVSLLGLAGCATDADRASHNLSQAADNFEITRRVVFYNSITSEYMLEIQGLCSLGGATALPGRAITVTCKTGPAEYKKHYLGLSDNVTYFAEQVAAAPANVYYYRVTFKPAAIVPSINMNPAEQQK